MMRRVGGDVAFEGLGVVPDARLATTPLGPVFPTTTHPGTVAMARMLGVDLQLPELDAGQRMSWFSHGCGGECWNVSTPGRWSGSGRTTHCDYWVDDWRSPGVRDALRGFGNNVDLYKVPLLTSMVVQLSMESVPETIALTLVGKGLDEIFGCDMGRHDLRVMDTTQHTGIMTLHISDHTDVPITVASTRPPERSCEALIALMEGRRT
jgi:hypothetical protein